MKLAVVATLMVTAPSQELAARSVHSEFVEAWQERLKRYELSSDNAGEKLKSRAQEFFNSEGVDDSILQTRLAAVFDATDEVGVLSGRSQLSSDLIALMKKKPSAERAELWIQEQVHRLTEEDKSIKTEFDALSKMKVGENGVTSESLFKANGMAIFKLGALRGQIEELALLNDNLASYYQAKNQQDADRRQKWKAILGSIGNSLQQQSNYNRSRMINCTTVGNSTNCMEF